MERLPDALWDAGIRRAGGEASLTRSALWHGMLADCSRAWLLIALHGSWVSQHWHLKLCDIHAFFAFRRWVCRPKHVRVLFWAAGEQRPGAVTL